MTEAAPGSLSFEASVARRNVELATLHDLLRCGRVQVSKVLKLREGDNRGWAWSH